MIIEDKTKLTSVVGQNEKLQKELVKAYRRIDKLRSKLVDPFYRLRHKITNEYMLGKPPAKQPPKVIVTQDEIIRYDNQLKIGTCYEPRLDEDEILSEFQADKNSKQKEQKKMIAQIAAKRREDQINAEKAAKHFEQMSKQGKSTSELVSLGKTTQVKA